MPEEVNRVVVDHVADLLFAPTEESKKYLERESVAGQVEVTGNTIVDTLFEYRDDAAATELVADGTLEGVDLTPGAFDLLTAHRAENVDDPDRFASLLEGVARAAREAGTTVVYPIHPRARKRLEEFDIAVPPEIRTVEPLEFFDFLALEATADLVFTDSGGVQEETCILGTPCVTLRYSTERPETVRVGANCLAGLDPADVADAATQMRGKAGDWAVPFGDGRAAERVADAVLAAVTDRVEVSA
jgi:UDP-N-acetylglucosamine 2-epimerase (non-hydrolysing)